MPRQDRPDEIRYANDAVDLGDGFGTMRVGDEVAKMALQVETPFTLGVVGKWGAGKTSALRRAFATLGGRALQVEVPFLQEPRQDEHWNPWSKDWPSRQERDLGWNASLRDAAGYSLCVWFSPWQHQAAENPLLPLLLEIRDQFSVRAKAVKALRPGALAAATLLERVIDGALTLTGLSNRPLAAGTTQAVAEAWRQETSETRLDDGQRFQLLFEDAVETLLRSLEAREDQAEKLLDEARPRGRLILFVDDLDRCEEAAVVRLLEAVKLYLGAPRCVFVLGLDEAAVLAALGRHWPGRSDDDNREYLEKLFQAVVPIPVPDRPRLEAWVTEQLAVHGFEHAAPCAEIVTDVIEPNPRKVELFGNVISSKNGGETVDEVLDRRERLPVGLLCALLHPTLSLGKTLGSWPGWAEDGLAWVLRLLEGQWPRLEADVGDLLKKSGPWEHQAHSLVQLVADAGWGLRDDALQPILVEELDKGLASFVDSSCDEGSLWVRDKEKGPVATGLTFELDRLVPPSGELHQAVSEQIPLSATWLQGDAVDPTPYATWYDFTQPSILLIFHGSESTCKSRLSGVIQQVAVLCELMGSGSRSAELSLSLSLQTSTQKRLERWFDRAEKDDKVDEAPLDAMMLLGLRVGACEWFEIQASDPDLAQRRGLLPGEPLPKALGLFDDTGRPHKVQRRASVEALRDWAADPDRVLDWTFRDEVFDGELAATRGSLREVIETLNSQPWGATAYLDAVLADWPEDQDEMDASVEAGERRLVEALEAAELQSDARRGA